MLIKLEMQDSRFKDSPLWIDTENNSILWGSEDELVYPEYMETYGKFPNIWTEDLKQAFLLGYELGQKEKS